MTPRWTRVAPVITALAVVLAACSAGDPPDPAAAASATTTGAPAEGVAVESEPDAELSEPDAELSERDAELSDADDATLDALEEQFEDRGVKDIRGEPGQGVTIRLEDERSVADAVAPCAAVRAAGFPTVQIDIDDVRTPCP
jgi:hypothetical protein